MDQFPLANNDASSAPSLSNAMSCPAFGIISQFNSNLQTLFQTNLTDYKNTANNHISAVFQPGGLEGVWAQNHQDQVVSPMMQMLSDISETMQYVNSSLDTYTSQRETIIRQASGTLGSQLYDELAAEIDAVGLGAVGAIVGSVIPVGGTIVGGIVGFAAGGLLSLADDATGEHVGHWLVDRIFGGESGVQEWVRELLSGTATFDVRYQLVSIIPFFDNDARFNVVRDRLNALEAQVMSDLDSAQSLLTTQTQNWDQLAQTAKGSGGVTTAA